MVKIDGGTYTVGHPSPDEAHITQTTRAVATFWIDVYPVTNIQYGDFLSRNAAMPTPAAAWPANDKKPVVGVNWTEANAYCLAQGKRLPSEAEWEIAARGMPVTGSTVSPLYPWGDDPLADGQIDELPRVSLYDVGSYAFNRSSFGVFDMDGNAQEWVGEPYAPIPDGPKDKVVRGGRYGFIKDMAYRHFAESNDATYGPYVGFRCAIPA